ncbi:WD40-repeat-containing domain protein, partial [Suillus spraguei]
MALSPNDGTVASGYNNGTVRLWNVETRKVIARWTGHSDIVRALCWSRDNNRVASGSYDGTARVWDVHVKSGETVLTIKTGHDWVNAVIYSPDASKIATGGNDENAVKIWDARTSKLLKTLEHDDIVWSLAWTPHGDKLFSGSDGRIRIFDTAAWQEITILKGHTHFVNTISLSQNERLLASTSIDNTALLWDLDTSLTIGSPLQHSEEDVWSAALSPDGKVLVTGCQYENAYTWDVHAILKEARLEDLLKPLSDSSATRRPNIQARRIPPAFFDGSPTARGSSYRSNPRSTPAYLLERFSRSIFSRGPPIIRVPAVKDREACISSCYIYCPAASTKDTAANPITGLTGPGVVHDTAYSRYHSYYNTSKISYSLPVRILGHLVLFLCCASPQHANGNIQPMQQQGQSEGQSQSQGSSSQAQPATSSTPTPPPAPAPAPVTSASGAAAVQPQPPPLRARFVLFLCCASPHPPTAINT